LIVALRGIAVTNPKYGIVEPGMMDNLVSINQEIGALESQGDSAARERLAEIVAPALVFRRADGRTYDDREAFLSKVKPSPPRTTIVTRVEVLHENAIVSCVVLLEGKWYDNLRIFVLLNGDWRLLSWANARAD
jgi:hypothetical protein